MKKLLAVVIAVVMAVSSPVAAFAATVQELGDVDFAPQVDGKYSDVAKTVRTKNATYKVNGLYYPDQGKEVFNILNAERAALGLPKLKWEAGLVQPAIQRALEQYMFYGQKTPLSHSRPNGSSWSTVSSLAKGENLAGGDIDAYDVMVGWMNSPPHHTNIVKKEYTTVACVCVETDKMVYWVQLFGNGTGGGAESDEEEEPVSSSSAKSASTAEVTAKSISAMLDKAKTSADRTTVTLKKTDEISLAVIKAAANWGTKNKKTVNLVAATPAPDGASAQGRMTINPANHVNGISDIKTGVSVDEGSVSGVRKSFNKWYPQNTVAVIKLDAVGSLGGTVRIGAKVDLKGLDTKKLIFYRYDRSAGKISKIDLGKAGYTIDKNKYLNFNTNRGDYVIVTDKELKR